MPIPTNTLTLIKYLPDNATRVPGSWRIRLETADGSAVNDNDDGIGGSYIVPTDDDLVATIDLPDTTAEGFDPPNAMYRATFTSRDRRIRVKSEPFLMDTDKRYADIFTVTNEEVTPSLAAQAEGYRDEAREILGQLQDTLPDLAAAVAAGEALSGGYLYTREEVDALLAAEVAARNAAIQAILDFLALDPGPAMVENLNDPGTFVILIPTAIFEDEADPGTYTINTGVDEDLTDPGTYLIGA